MTLSVYRSHKLFQRVKILTDLEMTERTKKLVNNDRYTDETINVYLELAKDAVVNRMYPYDETARFEDIPVRLHNRTCEIACYLLNKQGAEGESSHSENGVSRTYASAGIPPQYFVGITPYVGMIR